MRILVIGAGVIGTATAFALAKRGASVHVLDGAAGAGEGTSRANGGLLTPSMSDPWNGPGVWRVLLRSLRDPDAAVRLHAGQVPSLAGWGCTFLAHSRTAAFLSSAAANFTLADFSVEKTRQWREEERLNFDCVQGPTLKIFRSQEAIELPLRIAAALEPLGLRYSVLDRHGAVEAEPHLAPIADQIEKAILYPGDMRGDAYLFTQQLAERASAMGVEFSYGVRVSAMKQGASGPMVLSDGQRFSADAIIVCAGTATPRLVRPLGVRLPIAPAKGYSLTVKVDDELPNRPLVDDGLHAALTPLGDRLRIAGTAEFAGEDRRIDPRRVDNLSRLFQTIYPRLAEKMVPGSQSSWAGLRAMSADGRPFIGRTRIPGLWINSGHGHLGWTMAAGAAELLAALIHGEPAPLDGAPYAVIGRGARRL